MTNNSSSFTKQHKRWAFSWGVCCAAFVLALCLLLPRSQFTSSVLALLPQQTLGSVPSEIQDGFMQRLDRQLVWMVSPAKKGDTAAVEWWLAQINQLPELAEVKGTMSADNQQAWGKFFFEHRNGMIDSQTRQRLANGGQAQADWVLGQLYSAFAGVSHKELINDPFMLVRGSQLALQQNATRMGLKQGWLVSEDANGREWYLLHGELKNSSYDMQMAHGLVTKLDALQKELKQRWPEAEVLSRGTLFYSDYASQQAKHDVSTLGLFTVIGVLILIFSVFRSLRPLLLCITSVAIGATAGTAATLLVFGQIHLMTLVMSISIVGISADYTLYFLTERMVHGKESTPLVSLQKVLPALLLALGTTVCAYLIMMLAPFPGLRQLAVFAGAGLTAACLTVICWYPYCVARLPVRPIPAIRWLAGWLSAWRRYPRLRIGLPTVIALFAAAGLFKLQVNDDIAQLQALPKEIHQQELKITELTGQGVDQKWFVVYGSSGEETLQRLERLQPELVQAKAKGWISDYRVLPLSSLARQQADLALLSAAAPRILGQLTEAGIDFAKPDLSPMPLTVPMWQASVTSEGWRLMWISLADGQSGVLVPISGVTNTQALGEMAKALPGVSWVDRKHDFDSLFSFYRVFLGWLLLASVVTIAVIYMVRLGWKKGLVNVLPSVLSLGFGLAVLAFSGHTLNLFSLLALVLVLGIGINYTIFFSNPRGTPLTSMLAITLAMMTTLLTLGMLVFSQTQAISSFGIVLCSGIFSAFLLSPLALSKNRGKRK